MFIISLYITPAFNCDVYFSKTFIQAFRNETNTALNKIKYKTVHVSFKAFKKNVKITYFVIH